MHNYPTPPCRVIKRLHLHQKVWCFIVLRNLYICIYTKNFGFMFEALQLKDVSSYFIRFPPMVQNMNFQIEQKKIQNAYPIQNFILNNISIRYWFDIPNDFGHEVLMFTIYRHPGSAWLCWNILWLVGRHRNECK